MNRYSVSLRTKLWGVLAGFALFSTQGATVWTGPDITWTKNGSSSADTILEGKVVLKRGSSKPLFNTAAGETSARTGSPKGITFAMGDISNFASLKYVTLDSLRNGNLASVILNKPMVAHIADGDIYFSIKFTAWGTHGSGGVSYIRSTPAAVVPPTVTLTSPSEGATFDEPATVNLSANATAGSSAISGVSFYNGISLLGTAAAAPYNLTLNNLTAGTYAFSAVATASDASATSGVVHITVSAPPPPPPADVTIAPPTIDSGIFRIDFNAVGGTSYVLQRSTGVSPSGTFDWSNVETNTPIGTSGSFLQPMTPDHFRFFRVGRLAQ
jgi:hypothetical protein